MHQHSRLQGKRQAKLGMSVDLRKRGLFGRNIHENQEKGDEYLRIAILTNGNVFRMLIQK